MSEALRHAFTNFYGKRFKNHRPNDPLTIHSRASHGISHALAVSKLFNKMDGLYIKHVHDYDESMNARQDSAKDQGRAESAELLYQFLLSQGVDEHLASALKNTIKYNNDQREFLKEVGSNPALQKLSAQQKDYFRQLVKMSSELERLSSTERFDSGALPVYNYSVDNAIDERDMHSAVKKLVRYTIAMLDETREFSIAKDRKIITYQEESYTVKCNREEQDAANFAAIEYELFAISCENYGINSAEFKMVKPELREEPVPSVRLESAKVVQPATKPPEAVIQPRLEPAKPKMPPPKSIPNQLALDRAEIDDIAEQTKRVPVSGGEAKTNPLEQAGEKSSQLYDYPKDRLQEVFFLALKLKKWPLIDMISRLNTPEKPAAADRDALLKQARTEDGFISTSLVEEAFQDNNDAQQVHY